MFWSVNKTEQTFFFHSNIPSPLPSKWYDDKHLSLIYMFAFLHHCSLYDEGLAHISDWIDLLSGRLETLHSVLWVYIW